MWRTVIPLRLCGLPMQQLLQPHVMQVTKQAPIKSSKKEGWSSNYQPHCSQTQLPIQH